MINMVIFGPPGAGKGTQSEKLIQQYGFVHISTGDLFRWHTKNDTALGKRVKEIMNSGALVPDEITISMLKEELDKNPEAKGFLFDGFPRTVAQAEALDRFMKENNTAIHHVVALDVTEQEVRTRIAKRKLVDNRVDDEEEKLNKRIDEYFNKTVHVLPYYKNQNRLVTVNGIGDINEIFSSICQVIDK
ncbi:MAG: adenylate kinase [Cytophagia bacterium]|jgi:adenylate kinase|nr:adenylate kinase [Cytophagia bacterium]NBW38643.1 adenylate kinase [Cytophagia bacterium]